MRKLFPSCSDNDQTASKQKYKGVFFFIVFMFNVLDNYSKWGLPNILCHIFFIYIFLACWIRQKVITLVKQEYETDVKYIVLKSKQSDSNIMTYIDHIISVFQSDNFSLYTCSVSLLNLLQAALAIISGPWIQKNIWR